MLRGNGICLRLTRDTADPLVGSGTPTAADSYAPACPDPGRIDSSRNQFRKGLFGGNIMNVHGQESIMKTVTGHSLHRYITLKGQYLSM